MSLIGAQSNRLKINGAPLLARKIARRFIYSRRALKLRIKGAASREEQLAFSSGEIARRTGNKLISRGGIRKRCPQPPGQRLARKGRFSSGAFCAGGDFARADATSRLASYSGSRRPPLCFAPASRPICKKLADSLSGKKEARRINENNSGG